MKRILYLIGVILMLIAVFAMSGCDSLSAPSIKTAPSNSQQNTGIWVTGEGKVTVKPDLAVLRLGVESVAENVADAYAGANRAIADINMVIADKAELETGYFSISQLTRYNSSDGTETVSGYRVTNTVTAKIRTEMFESMLLEGKVSSILDEAVKAGGDSIRIEGLSFTVEDPSVYYDEARVKAADDAQAKAEKLAAEFGIEPGEPTYLSESAYTPYIQGVRTIINDDSGSGLPPISIGETDVIIYVQVVYNII